jgi:hypothetical protein
LGHLKVTLKMKCCDYSPWDSIHNTQFSSQVTNGPDMIV